MDKILAKIIPIIVKDADPKKIILFGSRVNGLNSKNSDYDLLIITTSPVSKRQTLKQIYIDLYGLGAPVDLLLLDENKVDEVKENKFMIYKEALEQGLTVYEK
ncbi:MAG: nucleotidyltransferase domain-containing protein [Candidatus Cloacimonetes bacterium]|nr:nucleotidyltransferase domain-containing protein [Candidatus Cloacimonadota bacterium]